MSATTWTAVQMTLRIRLLKHTLPILALVLVGMPSLLHAEAGPAAAMSPAAPPSVVATQANSCDCPKLKCSPCEIETGTSFYAEKCGGEGSSKTRSCQKPSCEPVKDVKACMVRHGLASPQASEQASAAEDADESGKSVDNKSQVAAGVTKLQASEAASAVANVPTTDYVGKVVFAAGTANIVRLAGTVEKAKLNTQVYEGDTLETGEAGKMKFVFVDMNELNLTPNSKTKIEVQKYDAKKDSRTTLLNLMYGRIRSKVKQKYDGQASTFQIRTKSAVAGVRGTDFVASFMQDDKKWVSEIQTISGAVVLGADGRADNVQVPAGSYASFLVKNPPRGPASETQLKEILKHGQLSRVYQMKLEDLKELDKSTDFDAESEALMRDEAAKAAARGPGDDSSAGRSPASQDAHVCSAPAAHFNQCSFTCEGVGAAAANCEKAQKGASCVRRRCDAAGKWVDPQPVSGSECRLNTTVKDCGAYW